jgi:hypothetical protein
LGSKNLFSIINHQSTINEISPNVQELSSEIQKIIFEIFVAQNLALYYLKLHVNALSCSYFAELA